MENNKTPSIRFKGFTDPWEQRKLGDISSLITKGTTPKDKSGTGEVNFIKVENINDYSGNITGMSKISLEEHQGYLKRSQLQEGDILFSIAGTLGRVTSVNKAILPANTNQALSIIRLKEGNLEYVKTCLKGNVVADFIRRNPTIGAQPNLSLEQVSNLEIGIPSEAEQKKIGEYFSNLDNLITLHQRKYNKLLNVKKSMLEKMFPKNESNIPEIRFKGFTDPWEQRKLGDVVKEITRNDPESEAPIMMITANNGFIEQSERYAFNNAGESLKKYILLKKGELAYNHGASKLRPYGSCFALTTAENARIPFVYHCFFAENQNAEFMSIELNGAEIENQLRKIVSSGARMDGLLNISFDEYTSVSVLLPSTEEQDRIADFFRQLDDLITLHQRELEKLQNIKKFMLEKMFV